MWKRRTAVAAALMMAFGLALLSGDSVEAQKAKKEKQRKASTKQLMLGIVRLHCGELGKALKAEEADWDEIALRAAMLNEAGYLLMDDGRCPDGDWASGAKALQTHGAAVLAGADKKDLDAVKASFESLTKEGCAVCHAAHRS